MLACSKDFIADLGLRKQLDGFRLSGQQLAGNDDRAQRSPEHSDVLRVQEYWRCTAAYRRNWRLQAFILCVAEHIVVLRRSAL